MQNHITRKCLIGPSNNVIETTGQDTAIGTELASFPITISLT